MNHIVIDWPAKLNGIRIALFTIHVRPPIEMWIAFISKSEFARNENGKRNSKFVKRMQKLKQTNPNLYFHVTFNLLSIRYLNMRVAWKETEWNVQIACNNILQRILRLNTHIHISYSSPCENEENELQKRIPHNILFPLIIPNIELSNIQRFHVKPWTHFFGVSSQSSFYSYLICIQCIIWSTYLWCSCGSLPVVSVFNVKFGMQMIAQFWCCSTFHFSQWNQFIKLKFFFLQLNVFGLRNSWKRILFIDIKWKNFHFLSQKKRK